MRKMPLLMASVVLGGCGANVTMFGHTVREGKPEEKEPVAQQAPAGAAEAGVAANPGTAKAEPVVRDVLLSLNATLKKQVVTDAYFDSESLRTSIATELRSRGLMGSPDSTSGTAIDILIDSYSLQATSNVGRIAGLVRVLDEAGKERRSFKAQAEATLQVPVKGMDSAALSALYGKFAEQVATGLAAN